MAEEETPKKRDLDKLEVRAQNAPWYRGVEIAVGGRLGRTRYIAVDWDFMEIKEGVEWSAADTITIPLKAAQTLMDDLWHCGIRPTEGGSSAGSLRATEKHLEDMRKRRRAGHAGQIATTGDGEASGGHAQDRVQVPGRDEVSDG